VEASGPSSSWALKGLAAGPWPGLEQVEHHRDAAIALGSSVASPSAVGGAGPCVEPAHLDSSRTLSPACSAATGMALDPAHELEPTSHSRAAAKALGTRAASLSADGGAGALEEAARVECSPPLSSACSAATGMALDSKCELETASHCRAAAKALAPIAADSHDPVGHASVVEPGQVVVGQADIGAWRPEPLRIGTLTEAAPCNVGGLQHSKEPPIGVGLLPRGKQRWRKCRTCARRVRCAMHRCCAIFRCCLQ
jgi:hypothetical protein